METLAFDTILRHRKIKHLTTGYEYSFSRKLDDHLLGREYELSINMISPFNDDAGGARRGSHAQHGPRRTGDRAAARCAVHSGSDALQADRQVHPAGAQLALSSLAVIGSWLEKGDQNGRRYKDLELRLRKLMADARIFVRGDELDIGGEEPQERIVKGVPGA